MDIKKESRKASGIRQTGNKDTNKYTKRKRINKYELVFKWQDLKLERASI